MEKDLIQAYNLYKLKNYDSLLSVSSFKKFVWKKRRNNYFPINYNPKKRSMRQNIHSYVKENGAFYFFDRKKFLKIKCRLFGKIGAYIMPEERSIEVDNLKDLLEVKNYMKSKKIIL